MMQDGIVTGTIVHVTRQYLDIVLDREASDDLKEFIDSTCAQLAPTALCSTCVCCSWLCCTFVMLFHVALQSLVLILFQSPMNFITSVICLA